jgi:hypothetical protein
LAAIVGKTWGGGFNVIRKLLDAGADPNRRGGDDVAGLSPLEICLLEDLGVPRALAPLLRQYGAIDDGLTSPQVEEWRQMDNKPWLGMLNPPRPQEQGPEYPADAVDT